MSKCNGVKEQPEENEMELVSFHRANILNNYCNGVGIGTPCC